MIIKSMALGPIMANCYIVGCPESRQAAVIDPGDEADKILMALAQEGLTAKAIIDTHGHFDHVGANKRIKEVTGAELMIHRLDAPMLDSLAESGAAWGFKVENSPLPDRLLEDGDQVQVGGLVFKVIHTPGHTPGGISLLVDNAVFVGDTLFAGSIGRTDFPGGDYDTLISSIRQKLFVLDEEIIVYPGHMGTTTIGREKRSNPFCGMG